MSNTNKSHAAPKPLILASALALVMVSAPAFAAGKAYVGGLSSSQSFDRFIVKYRTGSTESRDAGALNRSLNRAAGAVQVRSGAANAKTRPVGLRHLRRMALGSDVVRADRKLDRVDAETLMRRLAQDPSVEYVEVDQRMRPVMVPNDPRYADQWHYSSAVAGINLPNAWDRATGNGVVVAVLDTGITAHSELRNQTVAGYDFIDDIWTANDGNGRDADPSDPGDWTLANQCDPNDPDDVGGNSSWHGTHVSGTIAAATNNAAGVAGVAYGARVQTVRVLGRCGGYTADIADGIIWASGGAVAGAPVNQTPARVLNLSLGGGGACSVTYQNAINNAVGRGATIVVAAGNDSGNAANYQPSSCQNVVVVGATSPQGGRAIRDWWSSNYGAAVDIAAPGMDVLSTVNLGARAPGAEGYASWDGTSMATPHVAGVVALMQSARGANPLLTPAQVEQVLRDNARAFPVRLDQPLGAGIVDADAAVRAAVAFGGAGGGGAVQTYSNQVRTPITDGGNITSTIAVAGRAGNAPNNAQVTVNITHAYRGDLRIELLAPDGSVYRLKAENGSDGAAYVNTTYTPVNLSTELLNGNWRLRVTDVWKPDAGTLTSWSIRF